jgi:hypothetical protein
MAAKLRVLGANSVFALGLASLELASSGRSRDAGVDMLDLGRFVSRRRVVRHAADCLVRPLVDRLTLGGQRSAAHATGPGRIASASACRRDSTPPPQPKKVAANRLPRSRFCAGHGAAAPGPGGCADEFRADFVTPRPCRCHRAAGRVPECRRRYPVPRGPCAHNPEARISRPLANGRPSANRWAA